MCEWRETVNETWRWNLSRSRGVLESCENLLPRKWIFTLKLVSVGALVCACVYRISTRDNKKNELKWSKLQGKGWTGLIFCKHDKMEAKKDRKNQMIHFSRVFLFLLFTADVEKKVLNIFSRQPRQPHMCVNSFNEHQQQSRGRGRDNEWEKTSRKSTLNSIANFASSMLPVYYSFFFHQAFSICISFIYSIGFLSSLLFSVSRRVSLPKDLNPLFSPDSPQIDRVRESVLIRRTFFHIHLSPPQRAIIITINIHLSFSHEIFKRLERMSSSTLALFWMKNLHNFHHIFFVQARVLTWSIFIWGSTEKRNVV